MIILLKLQCRTVKLQKVQNCQEPLKSGSQLQVTRCPEEDEEDRPMRNQQRNPLRSRDTAAVPDVHQFLT